ncbi:serine hydrolase domain-containing protein [Chitinophaga sp. NPDC101104]|uniref:serine hydrolase domain-containing protein n=1 Tax=Chitinophaga sp. NPDC101104 TaxID=3390561 RepID=UPI003D03EB08
MQFLKTLLCLLPLGAFAQSAQENQRRVENSLSPWVTFEGQQPLRFNIEDRLKALEIPGVSVAVIRNYKVEWAKGYGYADKEEKRPVTTETLFQAASISKSLNGVAILKLVQDGKLKLDEDINTYLKTWHPDPNKGTITLAHLLSHTAGLTIHGFPGYETTDKLPTPEQVLLGKKPANTSEVKPFAAPGEKMQYSGGGTVVTQLILQTVTGEPYERYLQREVLNPMGMTQSFFNQPPPADKAALLATAYERDGKPVKGKYHVYPEQGAAGLWTNPTDLAKYIIETQLSKEGKSAKVLSQTMTQKRLTPYLDKSSGLGIFLKFNDRWFNHNGGNWGFASMYYGTMEGGNGFVIMTNCNNYLIMDEIAKAVAEVYGWKDFQIAENYPLLQSIPDSLMAKYTGQFRSESGNTNIVISRTGNALSAAFNNGPACKMYFTKPETFVITEDAATYTFSGDTLKLWTGRPPAVNFLRKK